MSNSKIVLDEVYTIWYTPWWKTNTGIFLIILGVLLSITLLSLLVYYLLNYKNRHWKKPVKDINKLMLQAQNNKINTKEAYFNLIKILKKFIQNNFKLNTWDLTDLELAKLVNNLSIDKKNKDLLIPVFNNAVKAKFASASIAQDLVMQDLNNVILFIKNTKVV